MGRYVRTPQGKMVEPFERYLKSGNRMWRIATRYKKVNGVMQEIWPLVPSAPTVTSMSFPYRNGRIELDLTWSPPISGHTITAYVLKLTIDYNYPNNVTGQTIYMQSFAGNVTSATLTNGTNGYGYYGELNGRASVELVALASGGSSAPGTYGPVSISKAPIPAAPTYSMTIADGKANHTWSHNGVNATRLELEMRIGTSAPVVYTYAPNTTGATAKQPWNPATTNGGYVTSRLRAVGSGGASAWVSVENILPGLPQIVEQKFHKGVLMAWIGNVTHDAYYYYNRGSWVQSGTITSNQTAVVAESGAWPRSLTTTTLFGARGVNPENGWTTALVQVGPLIKLPNPVDIEPYNSDTWKTNKGWTAGAWLGSYNYVAQGTEDPGYSYLGHFFYNNAVQNIVGLAKIGYNIVPTALRINIKRRSDARGLATAVRPKFWMHAHAMKPATLPSRTGGHVSEGLLRGAGAWLSLPATWVRNLASGQLDGVVMHYDSNILNPATHVTNEFFEGEGTLTVRDGKKIGTLRIYHDG